MTDRIEQLLSDTHLGTVGKVLHLVEVAEEEITRAIEKHPDKAKELRAAFSEHLFPGELAKFSDRIYRSHACEVLQRIIDGEDPKPGTTAECLVALSLASLKAPLSSGHLAAMEAAFAYVFPERDASENIGREAWQGETKEILTELRAKIGRRR